MDIEERLIKSTDIESRKSQMTDGMRLMVVGEGIEPPIPTASDNGKVLGVVSGKYAFVPKAGFADLNLTSTQITSLTTTGSCTLTAAQQTVFSPSMLGVNAAGMNFTLGTTDGSAYYFDYMGSTDTASVGNKILLAYMDGTLMMDIYEYDLAGGGGSSTYTHVLTFTSYEDDLCHTQARVLFPCDRATAFSDLADFTSYLTSKSITNLILPVSGSSKAMDGYDYASLSSLHLEYYNNAWYFVIGISMIYEGEAIEMGFGGYGAGDFSLDDTVVGEAEEPTTKTIHLSYDHADYRDRTFTLEQGGETLFTWEAYSSEDEYLEVDPDIPMVLKINDTSGDATYTISNEGTTVLSGNFGSTTSVTIPADEVDEISVYFDA